MATKWKASAATSAKAAKKKEGEGDEKPEKIEEEELDLEEDEEGETAEHGRRTVKKVHDPKLPTNEEVKKTTSVATCRTAVGVTIASAGEGGSWTTTRRVATNSRASLSTTWITVSQGTSSGRG